MVNTSYIVHSACFVVMVFLTRTLHYAIGYEKANWQELMLFSYSGGMHVVGETASVSQLGFQQVEIPQVYFTAGWCVFDT